MRPDRKRKAINSPSTTAKSPTTCNLHQFQLLSRYFSPLHLQLNIESSTRDHNHHNPFVGRNTVNDLTYYQLHPLNLRTTSPTTFGATTQIHPHLGSGLWGVVST